MANLIDQAQEANRSGNWSQLSHYLQQLLVTDQAVLHEPKLNFLLSSALAVLQHGDFQDRWSIAKVFSTFGDVALPPLIDVLRDELSDLETCWFITRILGEFDSPLAIQALVEVLEEGADDDLSEMAATALANLGASTVSVLIPLLENEETRLIAVRALAQIRCPETIAPLLSVVNDSQSSIRVMAIEALSSFHDPRIPPVFIQALSDLSAPVRQAAVEGLGARPNLAASLETRSLDLVALLSERLRDFNLNVCQQAAIALGRIGTDTAIKALFQAITPHTPIPLQLEIVRALSWTETPASLDYLQQILSLAQQSPTSYPVYEEIVAILGRWAEEHSKPQAAQILISALTAEPAASTSAIQRSIAVALGQLGQKQALDPLMQLLANEDLGVRLHAIAALKALDPDVAYHQLETLKQRQDVSAALKQGITIALQEW